MGGLPLLPIAFACPNCAAQLDTALSCPNCGRAYAQRGRIYRFILPEREQDLAAFLAQYRRVRAQDGYHSPSAVYYRGLPDVPPNDPQAAPWRLRAATFQKFQRRLSASATPAGRTLAVLDLGAGNGWLSNRLSALGHTCAAVDWLD